MKKTSIGQLNERVQLVFEHVKEDETGELRKKTVLGNKYWAKIKQIPLPFKNESYSWFVSDIGSIKRAFEITMRKIYISNALQSDLVGLLFRSKVMQIVKSVVLSEDKQWMRIIVVDYGVNNG